MTTLDTAWPRLVHALGAHAAELRLHPPANEVALALVEAELGWRLPADYRAFLRLHDGQAEGGLEFLPRGGRLFPIAEVLTRWRAARVFDTDDGGDYTHDEGRVRSVVYHPRRLLIGGAADTDGDGIFLDRHPGPAGSDGQLLTLESECDFLVLGESFSDFLTRIATLLERDALAVLDWEGARILVPPGSSMPAVWDLAVRLLGPPHGDRARA